MNKLDLSPLSGCNILITGATGLIGSTLIHTLMNNLPKCHIYALGRNINRAHQLFSMYENYDNFDFIAHDITVPLNTEIDFQYIIHLASGASPNIMSSNPVDIMKANIWGTDNLLSYGKAHNIKRFLFVSSGEVYGQSEQSSFSEIDSGYVNSMLPRSCYPTAKRAAETLCISYAAQYGLDIIVARPCHIYGSAYTDSDNRAYAQFIRDAVNGRDIVLNSDGKQYRSWLYVEDCVNALLYILLKGQKGEAYNVADENSSLTIREFAEYIAEVAGVSVCFELNDTCMNSPIKRAVFCTDKLRDLGWAPEYTYREALYKIIKNNKNTCCTSK